jgi:colicin import membrane protein
MSGSSPYQVPHQPGRWRAITLAVLVHLALVAFLWIGIRWQNETPLAVEAEIWDPKVREAAPLPPPDVQPELEPVKPLSAPEAEPVQPPPPVEPPAVVKPEVAKPDIALEKEKEKKRKELEKQREQEQQKQAKLEKEKQQKLEKEKQQKEDRLKKEKQDADKKLAKQKEDAEAKKKADADAKKKAETDKIAAEKKQKQEAADSKAADQRRQADLKRMMNQASSTSTSSNSSTTGGNGDAAKSQGPRGTPDYANKIAARIRSNTSFDVPADLAGNPPVEYAIELFPDGSVRSVRLKKPSGVAGFDEAVARAINKSQPFPPDKDGKVPNSISVIHKPKDSN